MRLYLPTLSATTDSILPSLNPTAFPVLRCAHLRGRCVRSPPILTYVRQRILTAYTYLAHCLTGQINQPTESTAAQQRVSAPPSNQTAGQHSSSPQQATSSSCAGSRRQQRQRQRGAPPPPLLQTVSGLLLLLSPLSARTNENEPDGVCGSAAGSRSAPRRRLRPPAHHRRLPAQI